MAFVVERWSEQSLYMLQKKMGLWVNKKRSWWLTQKCIFKFFAFPPYIFMSGNLRVCFQFWLFLGLWKLTEGPFMHSPPWWEYLEFHPPPCTFTLPPLNKLKPSACDRTASAQFSIICSSPLLQKCNIISITLLFWVNSKLFNFMFSSSSLTGQTWTSWTVRETSKYFLLYEMYWGGHWGVLNIWWKCFWQLLIMYLMESWNYTKTN